MPSLATVVDVLDALYDPSWAQDWDAVGLVCGDPDAPVRRVLFAVDPVAAVADEAEEWGADLIIAHHPLFLRGTHSVAATTPKGRLVHELIRRGIALHVCHTNADAANPGVSDALAAALGVVDTEPLDPLAGSHVLGIGRVGRLPRPERLSVFAQRVADALPATASGVRVVGAPGREIATVAVSGGAGDSYLDLVRARGVDAFVTADLRHHPASEAAEHANQPALIDVAHWASEWPWLATAATQLTQQLAARHTTVEVRVSSVRTDPWNTHLIASDVGHATAD